MITSSRAMRAWAVCNFSRRAGAIGRVNLLDFDIVGCAQQRQSLIGQVSGDKDLKFSQKHTAPVN